MAMGEAPSTYVSKFLEMMVSVRSNSRNEGDESTVLLGFHDGLDGGGSSKIPIELCC